MLIEKYCPERLKEDAKSKQSNKDCLARVYIGKRREGNRVKPLQFFSLRNFNMHLD